MAEVTLPKPVKLLVGLISGDTMLMDKAAALLARHYGPIDFESDTVDFNFTDYYNEEMGEGLKRKFMSFGRLISPDNACRIKILTNKIEKRLGHNGRRRINIDPGYIALSKLVLFTTKDFYHRLYLGKGIYAEVTLQYKDKAFKPFEWSYPDYKAVEHIRFFNKIRDRYAEQIKL